MSDTAQQSRASTQRVGPQAILIDGRQIRQTLIDAVFARSVELALHYDGREISAELRKQHFPLLPESTIDMILIVRAVQFERALINMRLALDEGKRAAAEAVVDTLGDFADAGRRIPAMRENGRRAAARTA